jgi:hypothetical protein
MTRRILLALLLSGITLGLLGCPQHHSIGEILQDPGYYHHKEVAVTGTVTQSWGFLGTGVYEIDDGTGRLWVYSDRTGVPSTGARVGAAGTIVPTLSLGGRSFVTVLKERERKRR